MDLGLYVASPSKFEDLIAAVGADGLLRVVYAPNDSRADVEYLHWDKLRRLTPPEGLTSEQWWLKIKLDRRSAFRELPLTGLDGRRFTYAVPDTVLRSLHRIDQRASGSITMDEVVIGDEQAKRRYLVNSLMEEAIRSSQLEGATTSRAVAKELLRSGREPRDRSERMIRNNYEAMLFMRESVGSRITPDIILELQRILTEGTLDNPDAAGRVQLPDEERVAVLDRRDGTVLHTPPPADELPARLKAFCDFANDSLEAGPFVHPVVRAIILHFWLGFDHPFEDGNGRTARAIFYWYMRQQGYWLTEYLSISRILRNAPSQYTRAYLYSETDEGDVTYFLIYHLGVIERAIDELHAYLRRKMGEVRSVERIIRDADGLNHRQLMLLSDAIRHSERSYTFGSHARVHGVTHETARTDLSGLADRGLLVRTRSVRPFIYSPPPDLARRLKELS